MTQLVIRAAQMKAFEDADELIFRQRVFDHLRSEYPAAVANLCDDELFRRIELAINWAHRFRFTTQASVLGYIVLMFIVGAKFDNHPSIHEILHQEWIPPDARLSYLADAISPDEWDEARAAGDGDFWERRLAAATA